MGGEPLLRPNVAHKIVYYAAKSASAGTSISNCRIATDSIVLGPCGAEGPLKKIGLYAVGGWFQNLAPRLSGRASAPTLGVRQSRRFEAEMSCFLQQQHSGVIGPISLDAKCASA